MLIAQAKHETGNFTSNLFKQANNAFGMKVPSIRNWLGNGSITLGNETFSTYKDVSTSGRDMLEYLRNMGYKTSYTPQQYVFALKSKGYFTDSYTNYLNGLMSWLN